MKDPDQNAKSAREREAALFQAVTQLTGPDRAAFLDRACGSDAALRQRLEALLAAHEQTEGVLVESSSADQETTKVELADVPDETVGQKIGRYKILEKVGEGGCGVVYVAEQTEPVRRRVALKVIKLGMDTKQVVARFEAERQALAMMDHPNIAKVLDAGSTESPLTRSSSTLSPSGGEGRGEGEATISAGRPYFVMELVRGIKITDYCDQNNLPTNERLDLFIKVCQAIQHAHQKGIIHRDIKPSNILVTLHDGVPVPKVIDFGIAKATTDQRLTDKTIYTQLQQFVGTPAYMSPEQAEMSGLDVDTRSDIYSLGVLLYELLTGKTPFDANELMSQGIDAMRKTIREKDPVRPSTKLATLKGEELTTTAKRRSVETSKLSKSLSGDLDWIVMKCLEKDRTRRYETANGLAMDLKRHLNNETVVARPPSKLYEFQKTFRRHKVGFAATAAIIVVLAVGIVMTTWQAVRATHAKQEAQTAQASEKIQRQQAVANAQKAIEAQASETKLRLQAQTNELVARQRAYASDMNVAKQALDGNNLGRALNLLNRQRPKPGQRDLRGWEWRYLWGQTRSDALFTLCHESSEINSLAVSSDGQWLAVGVFHRGGLSVWDLRTRQEVVSLATNGMAVRAAFSPTAPVLAFTSENIPASGKPQYTLHLWNMASRQMVVEKPLDALCVGLAFSKDGQKLVTSTLQGHITLWNAHDGTPLTTYASRQGWTGPATTPFAATSDLHLAAYGLPWQQIRVVDLRDGKELWTNVASKAIITALAFSPDGKILASAAGFGEKDIRLWDVATGKEIGRLEGHGSFVSSLVFWADGKKLKLASGSGDQTIRIWDVASRKCLDTLRGNLLEVYRVALMPDGKTLVSGCKDGTVCFWDTSTLHPRQASLTLPATVDAWCFEPDSQSLLTVGQGGVTRWTGADFQQRELLPELGTNFNSTPGHNFFSKDGHFLSATSTNGVIQIWDVRRRSLRCELTNASDLAGQFFGNGNGLVTGSGDSVDAWDLATGRKTHSWKLPVSPSAGAISPDAKQMITIGYEGDALWANLDDGSERTFHLSILEASGAAYSPDGTLFAVSSHLGYARVWDAKTWKEVSPPLRGYLVGVMSVAFSPDGKRLATGSDNQEALRLWDTDSWQDVLTLGAQGADFHALKFSPDGNVIGAIDVTGTLHLWRAPSWKEIHAAEAKDPPAPGYGATGKMGAQQP